MRFKWAYEHYISKRSVTKEERAVFLGRIDYVDEKMITGWALEESFDDNWLTQHKRIKIVIKINKEEKFNIECSEYRQDLEKSGYGDGRYSFILNLNQSDLLSYNDIVEMLLPDGSIVELSDDADRREKGSVEVLNSEFKNINSVIKKSNDRISLYGFRSLVHRVSYKDKSSIIEAKKIAIYVTFTYSGAFFDYQFDQVRALRDAGYYVIGVHASSFSNSTNESDQICDVDIFKANIGYDFGSWWVGVAWLDKMFPLFESEVDYFIIANDSCFGSVSAIKIKEMEEMDCDVVGICDSYQSDKHVQSFFVLSKQKMIMSREFCGCIRSYPFPTEKENVIKFGELALSRSVLKVGGRIGAICKYDDMEQNWINNIDNKIKREKYIYKSLGFESSKNMELIEERFLNVMNLLRKGVYFNPSHTFWEEITDNGVDIIKRELVMKDPSAIPNYLTMLLSVSARGILSSGDLKSYISSESLRGGAGVILNLLENKNICLDLAGC